MLKGSATLLAGDERVHMVAGSAAFVAKKVVHRFVEITSDLEVLVFFAPAESG